MRSAGQDGRHDMHILLVNDDGFDSRLLHILCRAAAERGHRVTVCAPNSQQSAKSHAFTLATPLKVVKDRMEGAQDAWRIEGTPVDACRVGLLGVCEEKPDLVISGINAGYNVGLATYVSGTVGAAREAAFQGYPALAVSLEPRTPEETISFFADYAVKLGEKLVHYDAPHQSVCNVNAPPVPVADIQGVTVCPITCHVYKDGYERVVSPRGETYFWLSNEIEDMCPAENTDLDYLHRGYITVTFLAPEGCRQEDYADFPLKIREP